MHLTKIYINLKEVSINPYTHECFHNHKGRFKLRDYPML